MHARVVVIAVIIIVMTTMSRRVFLTSLSSLLCTRPPLSAAGRCWPNSARRAVGGGRRGLPPPPRRAITSATAMRTVRAISDLKHDGLLLLPPTPLQACHATPASALPPSPLHWQHTAFPSLPLARPPSYLPPSLHCRRRRRGRRRGGRRRDVPHAAVRPPPQALQHRRGPPQQRALRHVPRPQAVHPRGRRVPRNVRLFQPLAAVVGGRAGRARRRGCRVWVG